MGVLSKETVDNADKNCCNVIKDLPPDPVQVVNTEFSVKEVQSIIAQNPAQVFVVMERGKVVGIVTEHDL
jgi:predicted transcriptional regulator